MPRRSALVAAVVVGILALLSPSQAAWLASAVGWAAAGSTTVGPGTAPTPVVSGRSVQLSWSAVVLRRAHRWTATWCVAMTPAPGCSSRSRAAAARWPWPRRPERTRLSQRVRGATR